MTNGPGNHSTPGIIARGCLMGAADIVPGVSGGTMALITGIYGRLLNALGQIPEAAVLLVRQRSIPEAFRRVDGAFLLLLLTGILISVISLAHGIGYLLENHERLVRDFSLAWSWAPSFMSAVRSRTGVCRLFRPCSGYPCGMGNYPVDARCPGADP